MLNFLFGFHAILFERGRGNFLLGSRVFLGGSRFGTKQLFVDVLLEGSPFGLSQLFVRAVAAGTKFFCSRAVSCVCFMLGSRIFFLELGFRVFLLVPACRFLFGRWGHAQCFV